MSVIEDEAGCGSGSEEEDQNSDGEDRFVPPPPPHQPNSWVLHQQRLDELEEELRANEATSSRELVPPTDEDRLLDPDIDQEERKGPELEQGDVQGVMESQHGENYAPNPFPNEDDEEEMMLEQQNPPQTPSFKLSRGAFTVAEVQLPPPTPTLDALEAQILGSSGIEATLPPDALTRCVDEMNKRWVLYPSHCSPSLFSLVAEMLVTPRLQSIQANEGATFRPLNAAFLLEMTIGIRLFKQLEAYGSVDESLRPDENPEQLRDRLAQIRVLKGQCSAIHQSIKSVYELYRTGFMFEKAMEGPQGDTVEPTYNQILCHLPLPGDKKYNDYQRLILSLTKEAERRAYRRANGFVYQERTKLIDGSIRGIHAWVKVGTLVEFVNDMCVSAIYPDNWRWSLIQNNKSKALKYFEEAMILEFPYLVKQRHVFAFQNGLLDIEVMQFYSYENPIPLEMTACNYIDAPLDYDRYSQMPWEEIDTPVFEHIFQCQRMPPSVIRWAYVFNGRMLYVLRKYDHFDKTIFYFGMNNSGKSTQLNRIKQCYEKENVGILGNSIEKTFGLAPLADKWIVICGDVKKSFRMDTGDLLEILVAGDVSAPQKNKDPRIVEWKAAVAFAGNEPGGWDNSGGGTERRLLVFHYPNTIPTSQIKDYSEASLQEQPRLIYKLTRAYRETAARFPNCGLSKEILGEEADKYFIRTSRLLTSETDTFVHFLHHSSSISFKEGECIPWKNLWTLYNEFCNQNNLKPQPSNPAMIHKYLNDFGCSLTEKASERYYRGRATKAQWVDGVGEETQSINTNQSLFNG